MNTNLEENLKKIADAFADAFHEEFRRMAAEDVHLYFMEKNMTRKLVKNGKILLDGTETEEEKEKMVFLKTEVLQAYEDETELDLVFILRALKDNTIYTKNKKGIYVHHGLYFRKIHGEWCIFFKAAHYVKTKDYGVTWALRKEELK